MWPNSGALEAGETARVQVLLLGSKVDLDDPLCVEECRRDRFQVSCGLRRNAEEPSQRGSSRCLLAHGTSQYLLGR